MPFPPAGPGNRRLGYVCLLASQRLIGGVLRLAGQPRQADRALFQPPNQPGQDKTEQQ